MEPRKERILQALRAFISQRPGLEFANYGDVSAYRSEMRSITRDRHHAQTLIDAVAWRDSITADDLLSAVKRSYSGRLTIKEGGERVSIDYCAGQYFPTEYRRAACAVLASAIWDYYREHCMPKPDAEGKHNGMSAGDWLRSALRKEFGCSIALRWFS